MSEASCATVGFIEYLNGLPLYLFVTCNYHLSYALTVCYCPVFGGEVYEYYSDFSTVIGIDGAGRIEYGDSFFECKATAWTYLSLETDRQGDEQSGRYETALGGVDDYGLV